MKIEQFETWLTEMTEDFETDFLNVNKQKIEKLLENE